MPTMREELSEEDVCMLADVQMHSMIELLMVFSSEKEVLTYLDYMTSCIKEFRDGYTTSRGGAIDEAKLGTSTEAP